MRQLIFEFNKDESYEDSTPQLKNVKTLEELQHARRATLSRNYVWAPLILRVLSRALRKLGVFLVWLSASPRFGVLLF
jgi:hypothetical protein